MNAPPKVGLALGSGASRGWSHIGVVTALVDAGVEPDIVCGTSVGAVVGASYAAGNLEKLKDWVLRSNRADVYRFFGIQFSQAGFVDIRRLDQFLGDYVASPDLTVEGLAKPFIAVSTDLESGAEVWHREGSVVQAVKASMSLPGLFPPVRDDGRWLVDGGLVNPVPVTACRALGADVVIAVNLNSDIVGKRLRRTKVTPANEEEGLLNYLRQQAKDYSSSFFSTGSGQETSPGLLSVISASINIFQDRITRSRLVGDPADVLISPKVGHIGILEFQHAGEAMQIGKDATEAVIDDIWRIVEG